MNTRFVANNDGFMVYQTLGGGDFTLTGGGRFVKKIGTNPNATNIYVPFVNNSTAAMGVEVDQGVLNLGGSGSSTGEFAVSAGTALWFTGSTASNPYTWQGATDFKGAGDTQVYGTVAIPGGTQVFADNLSMYGGTVLNAGSLNIYKNLNWFKGTIQEGDQGATAGVLELLKGAASAIGGANQPGPCMLSGDTFDVDQGATAVLSGPISFQLQNSPQINNSGTFSVADDSNIVQTQGTGAKLVNSGSFFKTGGNGTSTIDAFTINSGTAGPRAGKIKWPRGFLQLPLGGLLVPVATTVEVDGRLEEDGGTITVTGGTLTAVGAYLQLGGDDTVAMGTSNTGGTFSVTGTYEQDAGTMTVADSSSSLTTSQLLNLAGGALTLDGGTLTATGGTQVAAAATLTAAGTINGNVATAGTFNAIGTNSAPNLSLNGGFTQTGGTTNASGGAHFTISGSLIQSGGVFMDATIVTANGVAINGGAFGLNAGTLVSSSGPVTIAQGASLGGTGGITGTVTDSGSFTVGSATSLGTILVTGGFNQTSTGSLNLAVTASGSCDELVASGSVGLGGTLNVTAFENQTLDAPVGYTLVSAGSPMQGLPVANLPPLVGGTWHLMDSGDQLRLFGM